MYVNTKACDEQLVTAIASAATVSALIAMAKDVERTSEQDENSPILANHVGRVGS